MEHIYESAFRVEDRTTLRYRARLACVIRRPEEDDRQVDVIDISAKGFRGRCEGAFREPGIVDIDLPVIGEVKARVVWLQDDEFGAEFLTPIDMQALINGAYDDGDGDPQGAGARPA